MQNMIYFFGNWKINFIGIVSILLITQCSLTFGQYLCVDYKYEGTVENGTPSSPFKYIQQAIDAAPNGSSIRVAEGTYNQSILIANKQIHLQGGYPGASTSHYAGGGAGDFETNDPQEWSTVIIAATNMQPVIEFRFECSGSSIEGFTLSGGFRGIHLDSDFTWPANQNIQIKHNIIENNGWTILNDLPGAGIRLIGDHHVVEHNIIRHNRAGRGGGISSNGNQVMINHNEITNNIANSDHGGGLYLAGTVTLIGNLIAHNTVGWMTGYGWGGGVIFIESGNGQSISSGNTYLQNHAPTYGGGVFVDEAATLLMSHDLIIKNTSASGSHGGAGIAVDRRWDGTPSYLFMDQCTVADNNSTAMTQGNGIYIDFNSFATVTNSIFWGNHGDFYIAPGSSLSIDYCITEQLFSGNGMIHENPLFANTSTNDYHLRSMEGRYEGGSWVTDTHHSPGIDAGDPLSIFSSEPAPQGDRVNLGRYGNTEEASKSYNQALQALFIRTDGSSNASDIILMWDWILDHPVQYTIEHSASGISFAELASGECSFSGRQEFTHISPGRGVHYYRIKIADQTETTYSPIWSVHHHPKEWQLFPIPANESIQFHTKIHAQTVLQIIDKHGHVVTQTSIEGKSGSLDIHHLPSGMYFLKDLSHPEYILQPFIKL